MDGDAIEVGHFPTYTSSQTRNSPIDNNLRRLFAYLAETAMNDLTLESLAKRVEALEKVIATSGHHQSREDWRKVVGMFRDSEFMRKVDEECLRAREAEREAALTGRTAAE